jgi:hypothetical protein
MMPVFIYCVLASHSPFLWSELEFMKDFLGDEGCRGALGYTWVTFHSALTFILTRFAGLEPQYDDAAFDEVGSPGFISALQDAVF